MTYTHISMLVLAEKLEAFSEQDLVLDVRGRDEYAAGHIPGSLNVPHDEIMGHVEDLKQYRHIYVHCKSGGRAGFVSDILAKSGLKNIVCITGSGMPDWIQAGFPVVK